MTVLTFVSYPTLVSNLHSVAFNRGRGIVVRRYRYYVRAQVRNQHTHCRVIAYAHFRGVNILCTAFSTSILRLPSSTQPFWSPFFPAAAENENSDLAARETREIDGNLIKATRSRQMARGFKGRGCSRPPTFHSSALRFTNRGNLYRSRRPIQEYQRKFRTKFRQAFRVARHTRRVPRGRRPFPREYAR